MRGGLYRVAVRSSEMIACGLLLTLGTACDVSPARSQFKREQSVAYAELPGLRASSHPELRAELLRLVDERATPKLLSVRQVPPERNAAVALKEIFSQRSDLYEAAEQARDVAEAGLPLEGPSLERGQRLLQRYAHQRSRAVLALQRPECDLGIEAADGSMTDLSSVDTFRLFTRLEAFAASQLLAQERLAAAVDSVRHLFRYSACLTAEPHVVARIEGAYARREALAIVEALVRHPGSTREQRMTLYQLVLRQLHDWPHDSLAWMGDRALGLHSYEVIRAGHVTQLLTKKEESQLGGENWLEQLKSPRAESLDADEWYYLRTMRGIIEACDQPYFARQAMFDEISRELQERRNDDDFPIVAARLLLNDVQFAQQRQARDRAICEAWALALSTAAGQQPPPFDVNPLTGTPYQVVEEEARVLVWPVGTDESADFQVIELPRLVETSS